MKKVVFLKIFKTSLQLSLLLAVSCLGLGTGSVNIVHASASTNSGACDQLLADAKAKFMATLLPDGSVPASPEAKAAASEYIRVSKLCYDQIAAQNSSNTLQAVTPTSIDDGGVLLGSSQSSAQFALTGNKWGSSTLGTSGGTVSYSFMGNGISFSAENASDGDSVAITSLPGFQPCFITEIQNAFAAWQAVSNIKFVQVTDNGAAFDAPGAVGDIRIAAHAFDGPSGTLAHAYFPPPNGTSAAGDLHFDKAESWTCNTSGVDIGVVALHEIGHSLGLNHQANPPLAVMNPIYNSSLTGLQPDDINGATAIYGPAALVAAAPSNNSFSGAKIISTVPYIDAINTTGATVQSGDPQVKVPCDGKMLLKGQKTVWYKYKSPTTRYVFFDSLGSDYDTYIAAWKGSKLTNLVYAGCDDDVDMNLQSQLIFTAQAGVTYYIEVAAYAGTVGNPQPASGGNLKFHATSFQDVSGDYWAWRYIEGFYKQKITTGCNQNPPQYCPDTQMTRAEMAVFLLRALHGSTFQPNPSQTNFFTDVPVAGKEWMQPWIEEFYLEGITTGCNQSPLQYCPEAQLTRAEMAVFILRAKYGAGYQPNPAQTGMFGDVPVTGKEWMQPWIEEFYLEGITTGCNQSPLEYCPEANVTRAEMAVFIDRAFGFAALP